MLESLCILFNVECYRQWCVNYINNILHETIRIWIIIVGLKGKSDKTTLAENTFLCLWIIEMFTINQKKLDISEVKSLYF